VESHAELRPGKLHRSSLIAAAPVSRIIDGHAVGFEQAKTSSGLRLERLHCLRWLQHYAKSEMAKGSVCLLLIA